MGLIVHGLALVEIGAVVGEASHGCAVGQTDEGAVPEHLGDGVLAELEQCVDVLGPQLGIDLEKNIDGLAQVRIDLGELAHFRLQEVVRDGNAVVLEFLGQGAKEKTDRDFVAGKVRGEQGRGDGFGIQTVGNGKKTEIFSRLVGIAGEK